MRHRPEQLRKALHFDQTAHMRNNAGVMQVRVARSVSPLTSQRSPEGLPRVRRALRQPWRKLVIGASIVVATSAAAEPLLHEYIDLGPGEGLVEPAEMGERGASLDAPSRAADDGSVDGEPNADSRATAGPGGIAAKFSIDRDTSRPERVSYSDPFTPTVVPFKRLIVYDAVDREGDLIVRDNHLAKVGRLTTGQPSDEHFHASLQVDLIAGERTAIPSVAPGSRLVLAHSDPVTSLRIGKDSAENWFVESDVTRHVKLTLQVVADRGVFGSAFADASWAELARELPVLPPEVKRSALDVAHALGVNESVRPRDAVSSLVEHFRRFRPSERRSAGHGLGLYRELALTARGICRHRSYAFMITALGLGIPSRVAMNEAHAWVEVFDGELWHRIDLGGAAEHLEMDDEGRPRHVEPRDPFSWPDRSESGLAMAERRVGTPGGVAPTSPDEGPPRGAPGAPDEPAPEEPAPSAPRAPEAEPAPGAAPTELAPDANLTAPPAPAPSAPVSAPLPLPAGSVRLYSGAAKAERGKGLVVSGQLQSGGRACSGARVDILLAQPKSDPIALGTLVSDDQGEFRGSLVIPWNASLGEHSLSARPSGSCEPRAKAR